MDGQPTFDAARSAAMKTMLMKVAAENTTPPRAKRVALITVLTAGALLLAGGGAAWAITGLPPFSAPAPAPVTETPTQTPTPTPTPTPKPTQTVRPVAPIGIPCDELSTPTRVGALIETDAVALDPYLADVIQGGTSGRSPFSLEFAGGSTCEWGTPGADNPTDGSHSTLTIQVLPDAAAVWNQTAKTYAYRNESDIGAPYGPYESRGGDCVRDQCKTNVLVGSTWLAVTAVGQGMSPASQSSFHAFVQGLIPRVEAFDAHGAADRTPVTSAPLDCVSDAYTSALAASFGIPGAESRGVEEQFRLEAGALFSNVEPSHGMTLCQYQPTDGTGGDLGVLSVLPNSSALFDQLSDTLASANIVTDLVPLTSGSQQLSGMGHKIGGYYNLYAVDVLVDGDWIEYVGGGANDGHVAAHTAAYVQWVIDHR